MTESDKFKASVIDMGITSRFIYDSMGITKNAYYSALSKNKPGVPEWARVILWIYFNCGKMKVIKYLEDLK